MNEIITFGTKYDLVPGIKVLVKSAKLFCDKLTVLDLNLTKSVKEFLKLNNVNVVDANILAQKYSVDTTLSPYTLKVIFFYLYCKHVCKSDKVYMTDFTDVMFQQDPFYIIKNNNPYVISENNLIKNCKVNTDWFHICFNSDIFGILKDNEIINGGMYLGTLDSVVFLLKQMSIELQHVISRIGNYLIPDQVALNKLVYFDKVRYNIVNNFSLFNMAHFSSIKPDCINGLYKFNNVIPDVIHQYKTNKQLEQQIYKQYE
jgi:hypothetical protein